MLPYNYTGLHTKQRRDAAELERITRFDKAWAAYNGKLTDPLKVRPGKPNDNVKPNFIRFIVNESVSFLFGKDVGFEYGDEGDQRKDKTPEEIYLDAVWQANRKMTTLHKVGLNGAVCGQPFVKIQPDALATYDGQRVPRLIVLDPATVQVVWDYEDIDVVLKYIISYPATDEQGKPISVKQTIARDEGGQSWTITDEVFDEQFIVTKSTASEIWPYPFPPIIDTQNLPSPNEYWGMSDIEGDVIDLQRSTHFLLSNMARIIRFHAHPKTIFKGVQGSDDISISVDEAIYLPDASQDAFNLEMQSDLSSTLELYKRIKEALHQASETPEIAAGKLESTGNISGVALQILYGPLVTKTQTKRQLYGDMLNELNRRLLVLGGFGNAMPTRIVWPEVLPKDALAEAQLYEAQKRMGVISDETIAGKLGLDWDIERPRIEQQQQAIAGKMPQQTGNTGAVVW